MSDASERNFGLAIAYLLPGFLLLGGASQFSPRLQLWLGVASGDGPTVGGFLFATLVSLGAGLVASTLRWLILDTLHHSSGVRPPDWQFARLADRFEAFQLLVEIHYRYYQFYGNTLVALLSAYVCWRTGGEPASVGWPEALLVSLSALLFAGSRDTLKKYYGRAGELLARESPSA